MRFCLAVPVCCVALSCGASRLARAADPQSQAAEALFNQAKTLVANGSFAEACEKFAASQALEPGLGTLLYLGDCYERAGRFASALSTFSGARDLAKARGDAEREHLASVRVAALEPRVPRLEIQLGPAPQPAALQITLNGSPVDRTELNRPLPHDAGSYEINFSAPGYEPFTTRIELKNGETRRALVTVPQLVALNQVSGKQLHPRTDERGGSQRMLAWVLGGTGVALGATAGIFAVLASNKNADSKVDCDAADPNRCGPRGVRARDDAKSWASAATVAGAVGAVSLAGGVVLYLSASSTESGVPESALLGVSLPLL
jgi:tetratricopeptide (TPR) repeat protein